MATYKLLDIINYCFCLCILWTAMSSSNIYAADERVKKALVFGGNGFIGSEIVLRLIDEGYQITTTNRGNWYWDSPVRVRAKIYRQYACDRDDGILNCWDLRNYVREVDFFDVVVDLTAYKNKIVEEAAKALEGKVGLYILISSDSVYQVSRRDEHVFDDPDEPRGPQELDENRPWKEEDAVRPHSPTLRERLQELDPYAHDKLSCEEALIKHRKEGGSFPYVILRLPDVLGGRDTTNRWFPYQIWMQFAKEIDIPLRVSERMAELKTSFVFVHDVPNVVSAILRINDSSIWDKAFNIAFEEGSTLEDLLKKAQNALGLDDLKFERVDPKVDVESDGTIRFPGAVYMFPSVEFGTVDISRAKTLLGWNPTTWDEALKNITGFYKEAFVKFPLQRNKALGAVLHTVVPEERKDEIIKVFDKAVQTADEIADKETQMKKEEL